MDTSRYCDSGNSRQEPLHSDRLVLGSQSFNFTGRTANSAHAPSTHNRQLPSGAPGLLQTHRFHSESIRRTSQLVQFTQDPHYRTTPILPPILFPPFHLPFTAPQAVLPPAIAALVFGAIAGAAPRQMAPSIDASLLSSLQTAGTAPHPHLLAPAAPLPPLLHR